MNTKTTPPSAAGDVISGWLTKFKLSTAASELVSRLVQAGQQNALPVIQEVLEMEAETQHQRRVTRLRRASKLPSGKVFETFDEKRIPASLARKLQELSDGQFLLFVRCSC